MSGINRTYHPKWVTYNGDGNGRDGYIVFSNGGLNELRFYKGSTREMGFKNGMSPTKRYSVPRKDATAFDYVPDGSGRDSYVIFNSGLKRNHRSQWKEFESKLRHP